METIPKVFSFTTFGKHFIQFIEIQLRGQECYQGKFSTCLIIFFIVRNLHVEMWTQILNNTPTSIFLELGNLEYTPRLNSKGIDLTPFSYKMKKYSQDI